MRPNDCDEECSDCPVFRECADRQYDLTEDETYTPVMNKDYEEDEEDEESDE